MKLFSTEQVSKYHPDKYADQISDAVLTAALKEDPNSRVACECMVKGTTVILAGEITTNADLHYEEIVHRVAAKLNYKVEDIIILIGHQSPEIATAVNRDADLGAGDQGIMFGYATMQTDSGLPYAFDLANKIIEMLERDVKRIGSILKGDAKCQVTVDLDRPANVESIHEILISVCHEEGVRLSDVRSHIEDLFAVEMPGINPELLRINPAGLWTIGGPEADCGLTGRKIVCDQYGGFCAVGGGAFSGKDPSKVDRSAAYMAHKIAKDLVKLHKLTECTVQLGYAIGKNAPMSVTVVSGLDDDADRYLADYVMKNYDLSPRGIIDALDLLHVDYEKLAEGCHHRYGTLPKV